MKGNRWAILVLTLALTLVFSNTAYAAPAHAHMVADKISAERMYNHIAELSESPRITGFSGEHEAADYIAAHLESYGLEVERETFPILAFQSNGAGITVNSPEQKSLKAETFTYTPPTPEEGLTAEVVYAGLGQPGDFESVDLEGKIALIQRGEISFFDKSKNAADAGAVGVMIFNNTDGELNGTLVDRGPIPTLGLTKADGEELKSLLNSDGDVEVTMMADVVLESSYSQNVISTIKAHKGDTRRAKTIVLGAHYDSVDTPGANDNASGTAALLEITRALAQEKLRHDVRVIFFGAEEVGLVGSTLHVDSLNEEQRNNIAAMINMDMVGVGDTMGILTATNGDESFVADRAEDYVRDSGYEYQRGASSRSDHAPFADAGIPVVFFHYMPDPNYHTKEDTLDKISKENLHRTGTIVTLLTHDLANDKQLYDPKKTNKAKKGTQAPYHNPEYNQK